MGSDHYFRYIIQNTNSIFLFFLSSSTIPFLDIMHSLVDYCSESEEEEDRHKSQNQVPLFQKISANERNKGDVRFIFLISNFFSAKANFFSSIKKKKKKGNSMKQVGSYLKNNLATLLFSTSLLILFDRGTLFIARRFWFEVSLIILHNFFQIKIHFFKIEEPQNSDFSRYHFYFGGIFSFVTQINLPKEWEHLL